MKLAGAFVAGALGMWLLMQLLDNAPPPRPAAVAPPPAAQPPTPRGQAAAPAGQMPAATPRRDDGGPPGGNARAARRDDVASAQQASSTTRNPPATDADTQPRVATVERLNTVAPLPEPIPVPLSPAHQDVAERTEAIAQLHAALESEPEDVAWAYEMQNHIQNFLLGNAQMQQFGSATVHCRTALCEIQVIGYEPASSSRWSSILGLMRLQAWYRNFAKSHGYSAGNDEQTVIFTYLERNPDTLDAAP